MKLERKPGGRRGGRGEERELNKEEEAAARTNKTGLCKTRHTHLPKAVAFRDVGLDLIVDGVRRMGPPFWFEGCFGGSSFLCVGVGGITYEILGGEKRGRRRTYGRDED